MSSNLMGTVCPGDQFYGGHLSRGTGSEGQEVWGSNGFGTKCVEAIFYPKFVLENLKPYSGTLNCTR